MSHHKTARLNSDKNILDNQDFPNLPIHNMHLDT